MIPISVRRVSRTAALLCVVVCASAPAIANATTWTVDDDHADCPNAAFSNLQTAVDTADPHDTLIVCPGTYLVGSTPTNNASSPAQAGSHNGLRIDKPLTIKGAGASKVTIMPDPAIVGATLAGSAPYLRDAGGNVVSITRQSLGSTDADENRVDISGVTITSPTIYADAGVAFFNTSGSITKSVIGPLAGGGPYGYGVIETNSLQGGGTGTVRREVTVADSLITGYQAGGIFFDDASGVDGNASNNVRSGIIQYGYVEHSRIVGAGSGSATPQTGITYRAGQRGHVTNSEITANSTDGVLLADAETGADPNNPAVRAFYALGNSFTDDGFGLVNDDITATTVRSGAPANATDGVPADEDWWGCATGPLVGAPSDNALTGCQGISGPDATPAPSVEIAATPRAAAPAALSEPGTTTDLPPTGSFSDPLEGSSAPAGTEIDPVVVASDDFGVKSVALTVNGNPVSTISTKPYVFAYTPSYADIGSSITLQATITDSSNQTSTATVHITVTAPPGYHAATIAPTTWDFGTVLVGLNSTKTFTVTDTGQNPITLTSIATTGSPTYSVVAPGVGDCTATTVVTVGSTCTIVVKFAPTAEGAVSASSLSVGYTAPGAVSPLTVALSGTGHIFSTSSSTAASGSVPSTLAINAVPVSSSVGTFIPGVAADYTATLSIGVTTTGGSSLLTIQDPSATQTGHLLNGAFFLPQAMQAKATNAANPTGTFAPITGSASPLTLLTYASPASNDPVTVSLKQSIGANDALRTGTYSKTFLITLSTTQP